MRVEEFKVQKSKKLFEIISSRLNLSYNQIQKIFRNKDVKVNGKRVNADLQLLPGDEVVVYYREKQKLNLEIIYQDENLVVVFKKRNIETIAENGESLQTELSKQLNRECFAVHRLDRNTEGLVVFALNNESKNELDAAFKNRTIDKFYLALVFGNLRKKEDVLSAYLKKDAKKSLVYINDTLEKGYEKIITKYKVLKNENNLSLLEVKLVTGKTHQIRAHLAHIGHFIIGDEKYGDSKINKQYKKRYQCLCAYKLKFAFGTDSKLNYLNNTVIELEKEKIEFCQNL